MMIYILSTEKPLRLSLLLTLGCLLGMGVLALVPLLLRQTSYSPQSSVFSDPHLIPIKAAAMPNVNDFQQATESLPEKPNPPEPEMPKPEFSKISTPNPEPLEINPQPLEMVEPALPEIEIPEFETPHPESVPVKTPDMHSAPMNLMANLKMTKAPMPKSVARPAVPRKVIFQKTRFGINEVDQKPVSVATFKPHYPYSARRRGIEGHVTVQFLVDQEGGVREIRIVEAQPPGIFDGTVKRTVPKWRFKPGKKDGKPVDTWVELTIRFDLNHDA